MELLQIGPVNNILQNVVYALPARKVRVQSGAAVEVSNLEASAFVVLTNSNTIGEETAAQFVRCTTGDTTISLKA